MKINCLVIILCAAVLFSCSEHKTEDKKTAAENKVHYQLATVKKEELEQVVKLPAQLAAYQEAGIVPKVNGYVKSVLVDIGAHVNKGQLLMIIEAPEMQQQALHAKENYAQSVSDYNINKENYLRLINAAKTAGAVSPMTLASAKAKMESDSILSNSVKASWQMQQTINGYLKVTAPFSGVITERNTHPGSLVSASGSNANPMLEIKQVNKLRLQADVPESVAATLKTNDEINFYPSAFPGRKMTAKVARKSGDIDLQFRSERIEMDVTNTNEELTPGMYADIFFKAPGNLNAVTVPKSAVVTSTERKYVLAVREGKTVKVDVTTGNSSDTEIEVTGELKPGEQIVVNANDEIKEGEKIN